MKAPPIMVAGETFASKTALHRRVKTILYAAPVGAWLQGADYTFIRALLDRHPEAGHKIGVGVERIRVGKVLGNSAVFLQRIDGSETDFSWCQCIFGKRKDDDLLGALRLAIDPQIWHVKDLAFSEVKTLPCPITGEPITRKTCHVDHAPPKTFKALVERFVQAESLVVEAIRYEGHEDGSLTVRLADKDLERRWQAFHLMHAELRVVSRRANLSVITKLARTMTETSPETTPGTSPSATIESVTSPSWTKDF